MLFYALFSILMLSPASCQGNELPREICSHDNCLRAFIRSSSEAAAFCRTFTGRTPAPTFLPDCGENVARFSSASSCIHTASVLNRTSSPIPTTTSSVVLPTSTTFLSSVTSTTSPSITATSSSITTTTATLCLCTAWSQISPAVAACISITLDNIHAPTSSAIILTKLKTGAAVTFSGTTSFAFTNSSQFRPLQIASNNVTITGAPGSNSSNGLRIKTDYNATGSVVNVTYSNIVLSNIKNYGIDIEQDYLNGGPSGIASNGVVVANISFENVKGWVVPKAMDYYILCGDGSCENFRFRNVGIWGGNLTSSCNYPPDGCP